MALVSAMAAENTIFGAFGVLKLGGQNLANVQSIEYRVQLDREDIQIAGRRNKQYKAKGSMGTGTFTLYKVTSLFVKQMERAFARDRNDTTHALAGSFEDGGWLGNTNLETDTSSFDLTVTLEDPEQFDGQRETVTLENVKLWNIDGGFNVDELVNQSVEFTFEGFTGNALIPNR